MALFSPYWIRLSVTLGLIAASSGLGLVPPFLLRAILDGALPRDQVGLLTLLAGGMLALTVLVSCCGVWQSYLSLGVGQSVMSDLRIAVYGRLQRMPLAFFTRTQTGEMQSRITNDIGGMSATITSISTNIVASVTTVVANLIAMVALDWKLTIISLLMLPVFVWISRRVGSERRQVTRERQEETARLTVMVEESLSVSGFLLGRVMGRTKDLVDDFSDQSRVLTSLTIRSSMVGRWRASAIQVIAAAMPIVIYWAAGLTDHDGKLAISIGTLVAFTTLQQGLFGPTVQLLGVGITLQSSTALFDRIFEYLDLPIDMVEPVRPLPLPSPRGHVQLQNVSFSYGSSQILRDITIDVPAGGHLAIVGATGAGKTTLGYLIPRLYDVSAGQVMIDGVDVRDLSFTTLAGVVAVVSQETYLFHASVAENLRFAKPDATDEEIREAGKIAQIDDLIYGLPDGYDTLVGERGYRFSGGEKQRLAIARTILRDPRVLVLDEATSSLDTRTEHAIQLALDRLSMGRTTITIAHRLSTVVAADHIVVLDHGEIVEQGTHAELQARGTVYANLLAKNGILLPS